MTDPQHPIPTRYDQVALTILAHGWAPVPLDPQTKKPNRREWPHRILLSQERLRCEVEKELRWRGDASRRHHACGIVVPDTTLLIDVDLLDPEANTTVRRISKETLVVADRARRMVRVGQAPKFLLCLGVKPGTVRSRKLGGVELFCGSGQVAAFGVHQTTGQPYRWGPRSPLNTRPNELSQVTVVQVEDFIAACLEAGVLGPQTKAAGHNGAPTSRGVVYPATTRLNELFIRYDGRIRPAVLALLKEVGTAGHGRHDTHVPICGFLVHRNWTNPEIIEFLVPAVNAAFAEGDWSHEIELAIAHARNRERARHAEGRMIAGRAAR
jgi:hypothetical protein